MEDMLSIVPEKNNIRIKEQGEDYIVFNLATSGFHQITQDANEILNKLSDRLTIKELAEYFAKERGLDVKVFGEELVSFLKELELRKIVTLNS